MARDYGKENREGNSPEKRKKRQGEYMEKHGPQKPRRKRLWPSIGKGKTVKTPRPNFHESFGGGEKAKPHSTKEGRVASGKRRIRRLLKDANKPKPILPPRRPGRPSPGWKRPENIMTPLRAKHGVGSIVKKIITKLKPKGPKPKPGGLKDRWKTLDSKVEGKTILGPEKGKYGAIDKVMTNLEKQTKKGIKNPHYNPDFKAKGGRIGLKHGGPQSHYLQHGYGPHKIQLRSGKPKLAKKGW